MFRPCNVCCYYFKIHNVEPRNSYRKVFFIAYLLSAKVCKAFPRNCDFSHLCAFYNINRLHAVQWGKESHFLSSLFPLVMFLLLRLYHQGNMCEGKLDSCSEIALDAKSNLRIPEACELLIVSYSQRFSYILTVSQD